MAAAGTAEFWKFWEGRVVDNSYPLLRCIGGGASSAVFLTEFSGEKGRRAAIRLVLPNPSGAENQLSRWQRASKLAHPHLIRLLATGRCQLDNTSVLYLVMEYTEEDLSQVLPERPLTPAETSQMLEPALDALRYIHRQGFVHGRLKPANIMAVEDQIKISSDGLRRVGENGSGGSTPDPHDPPEIAKRGMSEAGDIWSLGVTLTEVLTQALPVWRDAAHQELILPESIPGPFADVIRHCLRPDPKDRWGLDQIAGRLGFAGAARTIAPVASGKAASAAYTPIKVSPKPASAWRYILPLGAVAVAAVGLLYFFENRPAEQADVGKPTVATTSVAPPSASSTQSSATATPTPVPPVVEPVKAQSDPKPAAAAEPDPRPESKETASTVINTTPAAPGEILEQVIPTVSERTKANLRGRFMVNVRVHVNPAGNVTETKLELHGPSQYFAKRTVEAARQWKFRPSDAGQDWLLRFEFEKSGFKAIPSRVSP